MMLQAIGEQAMAVLEALFPENLDTKRAQAAVGKALGEHFGLVSAWQQLLASRAEGKTDGIMFALSEPARLVGAQDKMHFAVRGPWDLRGASPDQVMQFLTVSTYMMDASARAVLYFLGYNLQFSGWALPQAATKEPDEKSPLS